MATAQNRSPMIFPQPGQKTLDKHSYHAPPFAGGLRLFAFTLAIFLLIGAGSPLRARALNKTGQVQVLDVMRVSAERPASSAVLTITLPSAPQEISCDVLVAGASTGGVAAALAAAVGGHSVCLTEETNWIGGQMTAQGVSAFDGNRYMETTGATASFGKLRQGIRSYYKQHGTLSVLGASEKHFNPGNCWVSALCFEAPVALKVLNLMLQPYVTKGLLRIFLRTKVVKVERRGDRINSVLTYNFRSHRWLKIKARYVLDATDTGELLPLAGVEYSTGAEPRSQTGEPHAREGEGDPNDIQSFTYTFVLARDPGQNHRIPQPPEYEAHRQHQPYTMTLDYGHGKFLTYQVFQKAPHTPGSFWTYRRLIASANFTGPGEPREVSMINWPGNDYCGPSLLSNNPLQQAQALREGKLAALGFVYWLQNEVPRDDGRGKGYPGLELVDSALGSSDGLSQFPYIRESRRIHALKTITEQEISSLDQKGPRAAPFADSAGIGLYPIDIHTCSKKDFTSGAKPFELPLGALIPLRIDNLLAASKDIGTTHITNGAYRLHPIEWAIGEAAGTVADFALDHGVTPRQVDQNKTLTQKVQLDLLRHGAPLYWFDDLEMSNPAFAAAQFLAVRGIFGPDGKNLHFHPGDPITRREAIFALGRALGLEPQLSNNDEAPPSNRAPGDSLAAIALDLVHKGFLPAAFLDASAMDRDLKWPDLQMAWRKLKLNPPVSHDGQEPNRSDFAIWLEQAYLRHAGLPIPPPRGRR
ncbi:MAG: FAD-dependent oxidoreductase [Terriglobia bacterium]